MIKTTALLVTLFIAGCSTSQKLKQTISQDEVYRIEAALSHDSMQGRKVFTPGIEKAAAFIASEMKEAGLQPLPNTASYFQPLQMIQGTITHSKVTVGNQPVPASDIICLSSTPLISFNEKDNYKVVRINQGDSFRNVIRPILFTDQNMLVLIDTSFRRNLQSLTFLNDPIAPQDNNQLFILTSHPNATSFDVNITRQFSIKKLANVIGYLPGRSKPNEYVIFSGHYDHIGVGKQDASGDSIYNGSNDDASGITAVLTLAKYFKASGNNERSLLFAAFTAEESGGHGSKYFATQLDPSKIIAMFNIEMIGTDSKWGSNSAFITGFEKTNFGKILQKNLAGTKFNFYPDPYPGLQLFYRSDNATLARKGVPAHTISTSKMDNEPHYHKPSDEITTLDLKNMTAIIRSIAVSAQSIISGKDTPNRLDPVKLN